MLAERLGRPASTGALTMAEQVELCMGRGGPPPEARDDADDLGDLDGIVDGGFEGIAQAVRRLADAAERIESSGLNRRGIVLLLVDASGLEKREVERLLNALSILKERFLSDE